jgi:hypothetical protein
MLRVEVEPGTQAVLVHLDVAERQRLLGVLDDWLNACVGVARRPPPPDELRWALELRWLLLSVDEPQPGAGVS